VAILLTDADAAHASIGPVDLVAVYIVLGLYLVLLGQGDGGVGAVSLCDDPHPPLINRVGAEDAPAVLQGELVLSTVVLVQLAPIPISMISQVVERILSRLLQQL
jgi:hypothetical protein